MIVPKRDAAALAGGHRPADRRAGDARAARRAGADHGPAVRHRRVRPQDGAALRPAAPVSRPTHRRGVLEADLSFLTAGRRHDRRARSRVQPAPRVERASLPGLILLAAVLLCVYGGAGADGRLSARGDRDPERRGDLLHDGAQPRRGWRPDVSPRGSRPGLAGVPVRAAGLFLKKGRDIERFGLMLRPPFVWTATRADTIRTGSSTASRSSIRSSRRRSSGCSAPTAFWCCTRCCSRWSCWCGYLFLHARMRPAVAAALAGAFVMASVVPVYFVWITPELFNFALGAARVLLLALQGGGARRSRRRAARAGCSGRAATSSPRCCSASRRSRRSRTRCCFRRSCSGCCGGGDGGQAVEASVAFGVVAGGLFAVNMAISGEWNYQGGRIAARSSSSSRSRRRRPGSTSARRRSATRR